MAEPPGLLAPAVSGQSCWSGIGSHCAAADNCPPARSHPYSAQAVLLLCVCTVCYTISFCGGVECSFVERCGVNGGEDMALDSFRSVATHRRPAIIYSMLDHVESVLSPSSRRSPT